MEKESPSQASLSADLYCNDHPTRRNLKLKYQNAPSPLYAQKLYCETTARKYQTSIHRRVSVQSLCALATWLAVTAYQNQTAE